jgi:hypothetical protein
MAYTLEQLSTDCGALKDASGPAGNPAVRALVSKAAQPAMAAGCELA